MLGQAEQSDRYGWRRKTSTATLAEVSRILAIHVAHYESKYGKVSMDETLKLLHSVSLTDAELGLAADAMEYLSAVIGAASGLIDDDPVH